MFSSASRCRVKAVPTHTPKGELLAGWEGSAPFTQQSMRLCLAPQAWAVLPQAPGHAVPVPRPSPSVPEATKPPGTTGFRTAGGGPGEGLAPPGKSLGFSSAARVTGKPEVHGPGLGCFTCKQITQDRCWLLEKGYHWPSSPRTVLLSSSPVPPGSAGAVACSSCWGPELQPK